MANNRQEEKIGDDIPRGSGKHADLNIEEENHNEGTRDQNPGDKDVGKEGDACRHTIFDCPQDLDIIVCALDDCACLCSF